MPQMVLYQLYFATRCYTQTLPKLSINHNYYQNLTPRLITYLLITKSSSYFGHQSMGHMLNLYFSLVFIAYWKLSYNRKVNLGSLVDTIEQETPRSRTISFV